jgi:HSP20 family protein
MAIVRWDPFHELAFVQDRLNRLFNSDQGRGSDDVMARGAWLPPVDVFSNGKQELIIKAEVPGLKREDIDVTVEDNTLTLRGEKKHESEVKEEQLHRIERQYGSFSRTFSLPATVDAGKVSADYKDGVLTIRLPFREEAKPKQIKVDVAA